MSFLDLLFPPRCASCGRAGQHWCAECAASLRWATPDWLDGIPLVAAGLLEGPFQRAIHTYKYRSRPALAKQLARPLISVASATMLPIEVVAFVPLHPTRQRTRGFNQAEQLAVEIAAALHRPIARGLERVRPTPAQVGQNQAERRRNMESAFHWAGSGPAPQGIGLVDDVCTTGATLEASAAALRQAGGSVAAFLVLALAQTLPRPVVTFPE